MCNVCGEGGHQAVYSLDNCWRAEQPSAYCPACAEPVHRGKNGTMGRHGPKYSCPGVGKKPVFGLWSDRNSMHWSERINIEDLDNEFWVPDEVLKCPGCETEYPFEWDADQECWWPGAAEWWFYKGVRFICSRRCWLKVRDFWSE